MSVTLGKTYSNGMVSMRRSVIQPQEGATLTDSLIDSGAEAFIASPMASLYRTRELEQAEIYGKPIAADVARQQIKDEGLQLTVPDQGVTQEYLDILVYRKREEQRRAEVIQSAPQGAGATAARFGAGFAASMLDPLNVASAFVPVVGQAKYLKWLGQAGSFAKRTGVRAGVGAVEGTVGAAMVEPLIAYAKAEEQADYDSADSLANIAFGTVFGGGLHVMGGAGADLYRKVRGATNPWDLPELKAGRDASAAIYDDINSQLLNAGRATDEAAADASIATSGFRSFADVSGVKLDDLYAEFGPRISFAREGEFAYANGPGLRAANQLADAMTGRTFNQTASPDFKRFFDGSKIVDEAGAPLAVYRGTPKGNATGKFFTTNPEMASGYAQSSFHRGGGEPTVHKAYLSMKNPLVIDALGKRNDNIPVPWAEWKPKVFGNLPKNAVSVDAAFKYALEHGHDGLIVRNVVDTADIHDRTKGDVYAVADESQVRSAYESPARTFDQAAYHGSPHDFDKFSLDKIGTGEGAQAYGWGLYFAENPEVAGQYKRDLARGERLTVRVPGKPPLFDDAIDDIGLDAIKLLEKGRNDAGQFPHNTGYYALKAADRIAEGLPGAAARSKAVKARIEEWKDAKIAYEPIKGALYQVDIPDSATARMLDWDKPLSEQPESVRRAIAEQVEFASRSIGSAPGKPELFDVTAKLPGQGWASIGTYTKEAADKIMADKLAAVDKIPLTGRYFYKIMSDKLGGDDAASKALRDLGIPGIRYKDEGSRHRPEWEVHAPGRLKSFVDEATARAAADEHNAALSPLDRQTGGEARVVHNAPTRNLVVFDDSIVKITHKDGSPVTAAERKEFLQQRGQDKRGSIDLAKGRRVNITLFQKADRSTFVHETGHLFLEVMDSLASRADAPEALKADLAKAREWMGLKDGEAIGEKQHEQFARGFEAYLREGKAPTPKLAKIFERFADWLVKIYKDIRALDVTLSDDVRGVYDRIIGGYPAAKKVELAGPAKREAALKAAVAQAVTGRKVDVEGIINGDQREVMRAAKNPEQALSEPLPEPLKVEDDDTGIESARESLGEIEALIKASDDEAVIRELDDLDEIVAQAKTWGRVAKKLAPCIGRTDG